MLHLFLKACFSAILPSTTARRGRQHGFFADNTPLERGAIAPPYQGALGLFVARVHRNVGLVERTYSFIERADRDPVEELRRVRVVRQSALDACAADYGVEAHSVPAIITSPPYLGMSDYTLGNRLTYYWLDPESLEPDFELEMGARRKRFATSSVVSNYWRDMAKFAAVARCLLRPGGALAMVLGAPEATAFKELDVMSRVDTILRGEGFEGIWERYRRISWHRNHGYQRLRTERVSVYVAR